MSQLNNGNDVEMPPEPEPPVNEPIFLMLGQRLMTDGTILVRVCMIGPGKKFVGYIQAQDSINWSENFKSVGTMSKVGLFNK